MYFIVDLMRYRWVRSGFTSLDFLEHCLCVAERFGMDVHLIHHRKEQAAQLTFGFLFVVEHTSTLEPTSAAAEHDDG